jgi:hypothetical protein
VSSMRAYFDGKRLHSFSEIDNVVAVWDHSLEDDFDFAVPANAEAKIFYIQRAKLLNPTAFDEVVRKRLFVIVYVCSIYDDCTYNCTKAGDAECRSEEIRLDQNSKNIAPSRKR